MAEFVDVLRQFDRMCKANAGCFNCPLHEPDGVSDRCSIGAFVNDSERIEREVMKWAEDHPVVYPTWKEWLKSMGVVIEQEVGTTRELPDGSFYETDKEIYTFVNWDKPIPADVAQRLGVEPKEEV